MNHPGVTNLRSARTVTLLEVVACEGGGTKEDPARLVTYYFTTEGVPVTVDDHYGIEAPKGLGADGMYPEDRNPEPRVVYLAQPDGSLQPKRKDAQ